MGLLPAANCSPFTLNTPAKINWSLFVLSKRDDGYHNIISLMQCIGLYDTLTFEQSDSIELVSDMDVPPEQNLVSRAARMLREHAGSRAGARITLVKTIPSGAGLGGGSSDAACALKGLNKMWGLGLSKEELKSIGARLGADVPFFFDGPAAIAEGKGEILTQLQMDVSYTLLLVKPLISVATSWAYGKIGAAKHVPGASPELTKTGDKLNNISLIFNALRTCNIQTLRSMVHNDFEETVFKEYPDIGYVKDRLLQAGAALAVMSGSGSAIFGLFEDKDMAVSASRRFPDHWNRVVETLIS